MQYHGWHYLYGKQFGRSMTKDGVEQPEVPLHLHVLVSNTPHRLCFPEIKWRTEPMNPAAVSKC